MSLFLLFSLLCSYSSSFQRRVVTILGGLFDIGERDDFGQYFHDYVMWYLNLNTEIREVRLTMTNYNIEGFQ